MSINKGGGLGISIDVKLNKAEDEFPGQDTYDVNLVNTGWIDITQGNRTGFITNDSISSIMIRQAENQPNASVPRGHIMFAEESINFILISNQRLWARSVQLTGCVFVTSGV